MRAAVSRQMLLAAACLLLATASEVAATGWQIKRLAGRDYLPLPQIASFYEMRTEHRGDRGVTLRGADRRMDFAKNSREARIDGVKQWLSFPVIYFAGQYYVSRMDLAKAIDPLMRPERIPGLKPVHTVVLDPGHGGHDRGAVNRWGSEKNYNLDLCRRIRPHLQAAGLRVVITRSRDQFIPLERRPAVANRLGDGTVFVSVHFNAAPTRNSLATGFEVFTLTPRGAPNSHDAYLTRRSFSAERGHRNDHASHVLATAIQHAKLGKVPMFDRGVKRARFAVLRGAEVPAVLIEGGFMSHPRDARLLHTVEWRNRLAEAVADGILEFVRLSREGARPKLLAQYRAEESGELARSALDYHPLEGISVFVRPAFPGLPGWRRLLSAPLGEEMPPFRLEYEPAGWVQLEAWAAAGEDARSASSPEGSFLSRPREWPDPAPAWPGLRGWRALLPPRDGEETFVLFVSPPGAPLDPDSGRAAPRVTDWFADWISVFSGGKR
jgi:N-acetylmuramoyl-L-alanine amidase